MPKKEVKEVRESHVKDLSEAAGWDLPRFVREAQYQQGITINTAKKAYSGATNLDEKVVIKLARLFGCTEPYRDVLEIRLQ